MRRKHVLMGCLLATVCASSIAVATNSTRAEPSVAAGTSGYVLPSVVERERSNSLANVIRQSQAPSGALPLAVDGAENPEQVPAALAYRHFVAVTSVRQDASETEVDRRDAFLRGLFLSLDDRNAYLEAVGGVRDRLATIEERGRTVAHGDLAAADAIRRQRDDVLDAAAERIRASLSPGGAMRLHAHINDHVRRRIKIYAQAQ